MKKKIVTIVGTCEECQYSHAIRGPKMYCYKKVAEVANEPISATEEAEERFSVIDFDDSFPDWCPLEDEKENYEGVTIKVSWEIPEEPSVVGVWGDVSLYRLGIWEQQIRGFGAVRTPPAFFEELPLIEKVWEEMDENIIYTIYQPKDGRNFSRMVPVDIIKMPRELTC